LLEWPRAGGAALAFVGGDRRSASFDRPVW
jgi:hypothetical protein